MENQNSDKIRSEEYQVSDINALIGEMVQMLDLLEEKEDFYDVAKEYMRRAHILGKTEKLVKDNVIIIGAGERAGQRITLEHIASHIEELSPISKDTKNHESGEAIMRLSETLKDIERNSIYYESSSHIPDQNKSHRANKRRRR